MPAEPAELAAVPPLVDPADPAFALGLPAVLAVDCGVSDLLQLATPQATSVATVTKCRDREVADSLFMEAGFSTGRLPAPRDSPH